MCATIVTPPHPGRGPKLIPYADLVYGMCTKVYTNFSARRVGSDIRSNVRAGRMHRAPCASSILAAFDRPELTPILTRRIEDVAATLAPIETKFAIDSTGFGTSVYRRWYNDGKEKKEHGWLKAHAMVGVTTNIVTIAIRYLHARCGDWELLEKLLRMQADSIRKVLRGSRGVTPKLAFKVSQIANVSIRALLAGFFVPPGTCPHCGEPPDADTRAAERSLMLERRVRATSRRP